MAGRVFVGTLGGGAKYFFSGPEFPPRRAQKCLQGEHFVRFSQYSLLRGVFRGDQQQFATQTLHVHLLGLEETITFPESPGPSQFEMLGSPFSVVLGGSEFDMFHVNPKLAN